MLNHVDRSEVASPKPLQRSEVIIEPLKRQHPANLLHQLLQYPRTIMPYFHAFSSQFQRQTLYLSTLRVLHVYESTCNNFVGLRSLNYDFVH